MATTSSSVGNTVPNRSHSSTSSRSVGNAVPNKSYASAASTFRNQSRSVSRGRRGKRSNANPNQVGSTKRPRQNHPYKIEIWHKKEGKRAPISLEDWRQMDTLLCISAAEKVRKEGPPSKGGMGLKNWTQHTHPGSDKASQLPEEERYGHAILRFSTLNAQEWYRPLVEAALGTDRDGELMQLSLEADSDDSRARYSGSVLYREFTTLGDSEEERNDLLLRIIMSAIDEPYAVDEPQKCEIFGGRLLRSEEKDNLWSVTFKVPKLVETALDNILLGQRYGILPTAICPVRFLKQKNAETTEEKLIEATNELKVQDKQPGRGKSPRNSDGETPQPQTKIAATSGSVGNSVPNTEMETDDI